MSRPITTLAAALLLLTSPCSANSYLPGSVVRVIDGDSIVLQVGQAQFRVDLAHIDAPEPDQPWGAAATRELRQWLPGRPVVVEWHSRTPSQLTGVVRLGSEDINLRLVREGLAWNHETDAGPQTPTGGIYAEAESAARENHRGLWSDPSPVPPWEWAKRPPIPGEPSGPARK